MKIIPDHFRSILLILAGFVFVVNASAQSSLSNFEFFGDDDSIIECKITSDFKFLRKQKFKSAYQAATFTVYFSESDSATVDVKIRARGNFRKKHCLFPPIKIKFNSDDFAESTVNTYNKLKIVTHCKEQPAYTQRLFEEYYVYKAYQLITDYSFRSRLLKITYKDTGAKGKSGPRTYYGFVIEDVDQMAERNNAMEFEAKVRHPEHTDREINTIMPVFQYMIGNTDWSITAPHNIKVIKVNDPTIPMPIPVPYDFDYVGLLNAPYAVPPEQLTIEKVTDRLYRGFCRTDEEFQKTFQLFKDHEAEIMTIFQDSELLDDRTKRESVDYLEDFFGVIGSDKEAKQTIMAECRTTR